MSSSLSVLFRLILMLVSFGTTIFFLRKIRKAKVQIQDVLFWLLFSAVLLVLCLFPEGLSYLSRILDIQSPANLLFLIIIFLLMIHQFSLTLKISMLEKKLYQLGRKIALDEVDEKEK